MQVTIRKLRKEDAAISFSWRNDIDIWKYTGKKPDRTITPEIEQAWIEEVLQKSDECRFAIVVDNKYIGNVYLTNIHNRIFQYHIFIGEKQYWGKGVGFEASRQVIAYAKKQLKLEKIFLNVNVNNHGAIRLYKKLGFTFSDSCIELTNNMRKMELVL